MYRTSKVDSLKVDSSALSSVIQIGDSTCITAFSRAIAVQRQNELFYSNEGNFNSFPIFSFQLPIEPIVEPITIGSTSLHPLIKVGSIDIIGMSSAAVLHIGNSRHFQGESRTLHIRQLEHVDENNEKKVEQA
ncbi:spore germination protein GerPE [Niallia endozanthoxylica]|uniref:Spore germination protein GerPE n=1 Tax=Niallia endozanthoxylica TaxID=2036016 RepID=A0A5J5HWZ3_9BACI|nr:spore germination protein GerPE [Niallia endozanthoxylica]KAA9027511.1 spore germination protein GerPE [Niallia endozanthoxylica]